MSTKKKQTTLKDSLRTFLTPEKNDATIALGRDVASAVLVVSVAINAMILTGWLLVQSTSQYDAQVVSLIFG